MPFSYPSVSTPSWQKERERERRKELARRGETTHAGNLPTDSDGFPHFRRRDSSVFEPSRSRDADFLEDWTGGCPQSSFLDDCRDHPRSRLAQVSRGFARSNRIWVGIIPLAKATLYPSPRFSNHSKLPRRWEMATITLSLSLSVAKTLY